MSVYESRAWHCYFKSKGMIVMMVLVVVTGVVGRAPRGPLARHRDVVTTQGVARGYFAPHPPHYAYLGLPYARPPIHSRFKPPKSPLSWDGIFEATYRIKCPQPDGSGTENCLVLNVFTPEHAKSLPVVVHIHGGGFQWGWGSHNPPVRLLRRGFVIVTLNYRLGPLGFLCLRTPGVPGNAGLKDLVAAIYWVHRNIAKFGGNSLDVTLYGNGSGGVSVELLLLSELTMNLVHRAIIESGPVLSPASLSYDPFELAQAEAFRLGFQGGDVKDLEKFYNEIAISDLMNSSGVFFPCVENNQFSNSFLEMDPMDILRHGIYQHVPLLVSFTIAEEVSIILENVPNFNTTPQTFAHMLPRNLAFDSEDMREKIAVLARDFYFDDYELMDGVVQNYIDYINDVFMEYPIIKSTLMHTAKSSRPVYLMKFIYKGGFSNVGRSGADLRHVDVSDYIFSSDTFISDENDETVAERLLTLWINFIKLGDPTPLTTSLIPIIWQPVSAQDINGVMDIGKVNYLQIDREMTNMTPEGQQLVFWDYIYEKFYKHHA